MVKLSKILLSVAASFFITFYCPSQSLKHKFGRVTVKDGLPQSTINHMIQDSEGFLWFATYNGIGRYDGYSFKTIHHNPDNEQSLSNNASTFLFEDDKGRIWITNSGRTGIDRYDPVNNTFENFRHDSGDVNSIDNNEITHIMKDSKGNVWICSITGLNLLIEENNKTAFKTYPYVRQTSGFPYAYETKNNDFFIFSDEKYYFDRETSTFHEITDTVPRIFYTYSIVEDEKGDFYTVFDEDLIKIRFNKQLMSFDVTERFEQLFPVDYKNCLIIDSDNNIWIGNESKGLYKFNLSTEKTEHFEYNEFDDQSIGENAVRSLFIDNSGVLWIGALNTGLSSYDLHQKKFYLFKSQQDNSNSLSGNAITALHSISGNELWVGTQSTAGINRVIFGSDEESDVTHYVSDFNDTATIATNATNCLVQRNNGEVWAGGQSIYVSRIIPEGTESDENTIERVRVGGWVFSIYEDSDGILWVGTWGQGLFRYNDTTRIFSNYRNSPDNPNSLCDDVVWSIYEDSDKNIWIGGNNKGFGILPYSQKFSDNPDFINFKYEKGKPGCISNNTINCFYQDNSGSMWIATTRGLNVVKGGEKSIHKILETRDLVFMVFKETDGLTSQSVVGIVEDQSNNLWLSTTNGISFLNLKDTSFTNYYEGDGLQSDEFNRNAYFINASGRIFLGGNNGFNAFDPKDIKANPFVPKIVITGLKIFNKPVEIGQVVNNDVILEKSITKTHEITLSHLNNVITIEFSALHYTQPSLNQYAYYLEGFEDEWISAGNERTATYTNLDPGKYIFHAKGTNNNGIWSEENASIVIRVKPPWWKTFWFRFIALVLFILLGILIIRRRIEMIKQEKKLLHDKIEEGERELQVRKDEIEKQKNEIEEQNMQESQIRYQHTGISKFADLMAADNQDLFALSNNIISELAIYTNCEIGTIYLVDDSDSENTRLVNSGSYCYDSDILNNEEFLPGEGNVGTCYNTLKIMQINNLPDGYIKLKSGLGDSTLCNSLLVPIINKNICMGVIELASFTPLEPYKVEFITKLSENFAYVIAVNAANSKAKEMLQQNESQAQELFAQEEELRQNLEEMQATQEESKRQIHKYEQLIEDKDKEISKLREQLKKSK